MDTISAFSVFLPFCLGLILYARLDINSRVLMILLFFASISQLAGHFNINKFITYNIYCFLDSALWGYLFFRNSKNNRIRSGILILVVLQAVISIISYSVSGIGHRFFSELVCLNNLLQLLWVLFFFYEKYMLEEVVALEKEPIFWFCLGILIYAPTSYFLFAFHDTISSGTNLRYSNLWSIHGLVNTFMYVIFSIGIYINVIRTLKHRNVTSRLNS